MSTLRNDFWVFRTNKDIWKIALVSIGIVGLCAVAFYMGARVGNLSQNEQDHEIDVQMNLFDMEESKQQLVYLQKPSDFSNNINFITNGTGEPRLCDSLECQETCKMQKRVLINYISLKILGCKRGFDTIIC